MSFPDHRPPPAKRCFSSKVIEEVIGDVGGRIKDRELAQIFVNCFPNTLDTTVDFSRDKEGRPDGFVITGDIDAMWLRDSANQMQSYLPLLTADDSPDSIASLYRGVINLQSRYLLTSPHCNAFQAPEESGIPPSVNSAAADDTVTPPYSNTSVFECKYELDSLAAFLEVSTDYYAATGDADFFGRFQWVAAG